MQFATTLTERKPDAKPPHKTIREIQKNNRK